MLGIQCISKQDPCAYQFLLCLHFLYKYLWRFGNQTIRFQCLFVITQSVLLVSLFNQIIHFIFKSSIKEGIVVASS